MTAYQEAQQLREASADNVRTWCHDNGIPNPHSVLSELQKIADPYNVLTPLEKERNLYNLSKDISNHITPAVKPEPEGLVLRTIIDIAFSNLVISYTDRQKAIDTIFARIETLQIGDWITEDTGRKYELTYIPKQR